LSSGHFNYCVQCLVVLFQVLTGSNWHEVMYSAVWSTNNWAYGFLLMFVWGALALVLMNLVVSLVIESYLQINQTTLEEQSTQPTEIEDEEELRQHEEELKPQVSRKRRMTEQMFSPEFLETMQFDWMLEAAQNMPSITAQIRAHGLGAVDVEEADNNNNVDSTTKPSSPSSTAAPIAVADSSAEDSVEQGTDPSPAAQILKG